MHFIQTVLRNLRRGSDPSPNIPRNTKGETAVQEAIRLSNEATVRFTKCALRTLATTREVVKH